MKKIITLLSICLLSVFSLKAQVEIVSSGSQSSYTLTVPGAFQLRAGIQVTFKAHLDCFAGVSINVNGTGAVQIRKQGNSTALAANDILSNQVVTIVYDGAFWQMISAVGNGTTTNAADRYLSNLLSPTAANQDLSPGLANSFNLGSTTHNWQDFYLGGRLYLDNDTWLDNGANSTFIGTRINPAITSGLYNVGVGVFAGTAITTGNRNVLLGDGAGQYITTSSDNTMLGNLAGGLISNPGSQNTYVGSYAGYLANNSGSNNTFLGYMTGSSNTTGNNNTLIGHGANVGSGALTNATAIGYNAVVNTSNSLVLGGTGASIVNVGIGTSSPLQRLHVEGNMHLAFAFMPGGNAGTSGQILTSQGPGNPPLWQNAASQGLVSGTGAATRVAFWNGTNSLSSNANLYWDNTNSRLGIGTANPTVALHIYGTDNTSFPTSNGGSPQTGLRLHNHDLTNNNYSSIAFSAFLSNSSIAEMSKIVGINVNHTSGTQRGDLVFMTNDAGISEKMRITGPGNVGIGTGGGGSSSRLHVHATSGSGNFRLTSASTGLLDTDGFTISNDGTTNLFMSQLENADWYFSTNSLTTMTIKPTGRVGVGEINPSNKFEVLSNDVAVRYAGQFMNRATNGPGNILGAVFGASDGVNAAGTTKYGGLFQSANGGGTNYGVWGEAIGGTGTNIAGYFNATGASSVNWAGYFASGNIYVTNRIRIGSSTSIPAEIIHVSTTDSDIDLETYSTTESSSLHIKRARGTVSSPSLSVSGDYYGGIGFQGWNGSSFQEGARIQAVFDGTPSATSMPGRIEFWTTPNGSNTAVKRMEINNAGNVGVGSTALTTTDLYVTRSASNFGSNNSTIFANRPGISGNASSGGAGWATGSVDASIKGNSSWGNNYTAGVAGYNYLGDYTGVQVASVIGLNLSLTSIFGALAYRDNNIDYAGYFSGNVRVTGNHQIIGNLSKGSGTFMIDHPLDPQNKYLYHSFVESPDMMNIYNGNIITNASGIAEVTLPNYFEALNMEFRYQLTVIGDFAQAIILEKVNGNKFKIKTDKPNVEVSWQVTGVRKDPYANNNRVIPEVEKEPEYKGKYLHPEAYGVSPERGIGYQKNELVPKEK
jgi:hypothetical protein